MLEVESHFRILCFFPGGLFGQMESINVAGVLQEAADADSRACTRAKCNFIISLLFTLSHLLDCLIFIGNAMSIVLLLELVGEWARWWLVDLY